MLYDKNGIQVDNTRYIVFGETFPINSIASVVAEKEKKGNSFFLALGIALLLYGLYGVFGWYIDINGAPDVNLFRTIERLLPLVLPMVATLFGLVIAINTIPSLRYVVQISTSAGSRDTYKSKDRNEILEIVNAINEGVISRG